MRICCGYLIFVFCLFLFFWNSLRGYSWLFVAENEAVAIFRGYFKPSWLFLFEIMAIRGYSWLKKDYSYTMAIFARGYFHF